MLGSLLQDILQDILEDKALVESILHAPPYYFARCPCPSPWQDAIPSVGYPPSYVSSLSLHLGPLLSSLTPDVGRLTVISPLSLCGQRVLSLLVLGNLVGGVLLADLSLTVGSSSLGDVDHCE